MSVYKVPQNVEAEDKLVGPFSFRQFVYLIIAAGCGFITFVLFQAPMPVPFFSVPVILLGLAFIIIALPLRKDQPMELYVLALLRFYFKPKRRLWHPDGTTTGVIIEAPHTVQKQLTKDITEEEAATKLSYLAQIVDTRGWATKGVTMPTATNSSVKIAVADEANQADDVLDENNNLAKSFDTLIARQKEVSRTAAVKKMHHLSQAPPVKPKVVSAPAQQAPADDHAYDIHYNPYPSMHQQVINPLATQPPDTTEPITTMAPEPPKQALPNQVSPDIMRLANNNDLSIEAIAHEAHRLKDSEQEVVISLR